MGKPKPFQRPRVEVVSEWIGTTKTWQDVSPDLISVGDMIIGKGQVTDVALRVREWDMSKEEYVTRYTFMMKSGQRLNFTEHDTIRVFTQGVSPWQAPSNTPR